MASYKKADYAFINHNEEAYYQHQNDLNCVAKNPGSLLTKIRKQDERKREFQLTFDHSSLLM